MTCRHLIIGGGSNRYPEIKFDQAGLFMWDGVHLSDIGNDIFLINLQRGMSYLFYTLLFTNLFIYILVQNFFFETSLVYIVIESPGQKHVYVIAQINITLTEYTVIG